MPALSVNLIYNRSNTFGLASDAAVLEELLREQTAESISQIHHIDPCEPPRYADIQFHLEVPIAAAFAWSPVNIFIKNAEHYVDGYDAYMGNFDAIINRERDAWCLPKEVAVELSAPGRTATSSFLSLVGGSANKADALVSQILPFWKANYPPFHIYTTRTDLQTQMEAAVSATASTIPSNIHIHHQQLTKSQITNLQKTHRGHIIASTAEGFCYAAAEAEACGAFKILSDIPVLRAQYKESADTAFVASASADLESAMQKFASWEPQAPSVSNTLSRRSAAADMISAILKNCKPLIANRKPTGNIHLPPILQPDACPPISIITLTYNRRNFIDLACLNLLLTDYPKDKIEWVVVEDSDDDSKAASDKILGFASRNPQIQVSYVPIGHRLTVGEKRNKGIERATNDIILFMDDDDVYPETSFRRRVAWLLKGGMGAGCQQPQAVATTTIAMYDLRTGQSAVNVPPLQLPLGQRISEATLTFYKRFWVERAFSNARVGEAEDWLKGRESALLEIPPQQIIVALSHGANISSRSIPKEAKVGCFWGWDEVMLRFLHGLAGVAVEAEGGSKKKTKAAGKR